MLVTIAFTLWWREGEPDRIMLNTGDPRFTDQDGMRPGLWITFSTNRRSADYDPKNYNRCVRFLRSQGAAVPPRSRSGPGACVIAGVSSSRVWYGRCRLHSARAACGRWLCPGPQSPSRPGCLWRHEREVVLRRAMSSRLAARATVSSSSRSSSRMRRSVTCCSRVTMRVLSWSMSAGHRARTRASPSHRAPGQGRPRARRTPRQRWRRRRSRLPQSTT